MLDASWPSSLCKLSDKDGSKLFRKIIDFTLSTSYSSGITGFNWPQGGSTHLVKPWVLGVCIVVTSLSMVPDSHTKWALLPRPPNRLQHVLGRQAQESPEGIFFYILNILKLDLNSLGPGIVHNLLDLIRGVDLLLAVGPVTCKPRKRGEEQGKALGRNITIQVFIYIFSQLWKTWTKIDIF